MPSSKIVIQTENAPAPISVLSQGLIIGDMVYCSGQIGMDPKTMKMVEGSVKDRTAQILRNLGAVLEAGGSSLANAVKVNVFLADMKDFDEMNSVYDEFFPAPKPVRTCVSVKALPRGTDVEIECTGFVGN